MRDGADSIMSIVPVVPLPPFAGSVKVTMVWHPCWAFGRRDERARAFFGERRTVRRRREHLPKRRMHLWEVVALANERGMQLSKFTITSGSARPVTAFEFTGTPAVMVVPVPIVIRSLEEWETAIGPGNPPPADWFEAPEAPTVLAFDSVTPASLEPETNT